MIRIASVVAALALSCASANAHGPRFVLHTGEDGTADAVRVDTHTGAVAVMDEDAEGGPGWRRIRFVEGSWQPKGYGGPSYYLEGMPLAVGATYLVDGDGGRTWLLRESEAGLFFEEVGDAR